MSGRPAPAGQRRGGGGPAPRRPTSPAMMIPQSEGKAPGGFGIDQWVQNQTQQVQRPGTMPPPNVAYPAHSPPTSDEHYGYSAHPPPRHHTASRETPGYPPPQAAPAPGSNPSAGGARRRTGPSRPQSAYEQNMQQYQYPPPGQRPGPPPHAQQQYPGHYGHGPGSDGDRDYDDVEYTSPQKAYDDRAGIVVGGDPRAGRPPPEGYYPPYGGVPGAPQPPYGYPPGAYGYDDPYAMDAAYYNQPGPQIPDPLPPKKALPAPSTSRTPAPAAAQAPPPPPPQAPPAAAPAPGPAPTRETSRRTRDRRRSQSQHRKGAGELRMSIGGDPRTSGARPEEPPADQNPLLERRRQERLAAMNAQAAQAGQKQAPKPSPKPSPAPTPAPPPPAEPPKEPEPPKEEKNTFTQTEEEYKLFKEFLAMKKAAAAEAEKPPAAEPPSKPEPAPAAPPPPPREESRPPAPRGRYSEQPKHEEPSMALAPIRNDPDPLDFQDDYRRDYESYGGYGGPDYGYGEPPRPAKTPGPKEAPTSRYQTPSGDMHGDVPGGFPGGFPGRESGGYGYDDYPGEVPGGFPGGFPGEYSHRPESRAPVPPPPPPPQKHEPPPPAPKPKPAAAPPAPPMPEFSIVPVVPPQLMKPAYPGLMPGMMPGMLPPSEYDHDSGLALDPHHEREYNDRYMRDSRGLEDQFGRMGINDYGREEYGRPPGPPRHASEQYERDPRSAGGYTPQSVGGYPPPPPGVRYFNPHEQYEGGRGDPRSPDRDMGPPPSSRGRGGRPMGPDRYSMDESEYRRMSQGPGGPGGPGGPVRTHGGRGGSGAYPPESLYQPPQRRPGRRREGEFKVDRDKIARRALQDMGFYFEEVGDELIVYEELTEEDLDALEEMTHRHRFGQPRPPKPAPQPPREPTPPPPPERSPPMPQQHPPQSHRTPGPPQQARWGAPPINRQGQPPQQRPQQQQHQYQQPPPPRSPEPVVQQQQTPPPQPKKQGRRIGGGLVEDPENPGTFLNYRRNPVN